MANSPANHSPIAALNRPTISISTGRGYSTYPGVGIVRKNAMRIIDELGGRRPVFSRSRVRHNKPIVRFLINRLFSHCRVFITIGRVRNTVEVYDEVSEEFKRTHDGTADYRHRRRI